jgi:hypothetical protein
VQGAILQYFAMRRADLTHCENSSMYAAYLVNELGMASVLGVQILLCLVPAGLATVLAHHVEDLCGTHNIACAHHIHHQSFHTVRAFC